MPTSQLRSADVRAFQALPMDQLTQPGAPPKID
jgi:hypothetical protein